MPALSKAKHELFAQKLAEGLTASTAYVLAGFSENRGNASTLSRKQYIVDRVEELKATRQHIEKAATQQAIQAVGVTREQVIEQLRRIGFADIRKAVKWGPTQKIREMLDGNIVMSNGVTLLDSSEIDEETAAAISEVSNTKEGIKIKFYDKRGALVELLRILNTGEGEGGEEQQPDAEKPAGSNVLHFDEALKRFAK